MFHCVMNPANGAGGVRVLQCESSAKRVKALASVVTSHMARASPHQRESVTGFGHF